MTSGIQCGILAPGLFGSGGGGSYSPAMSRSQPLPILRFSFPDLLGRRLVDPNLNVSKRLFDSKNRVTQTLDGKGEGTFISYNLDGTISQILDAANNATLFAYTPEARISTITDPQGGITQFQYDPAGNQTQVTDPRLNVTATTFDAAGQISQTVLPTDSSSRVPTVSYGFDALGHLVSTNLPNANQSNTSLINVVNAANLILNGDLETVDPQQLNAVQLYWIPSGGAFGSLTSHSGIRSIGAGVSTSATSSWLQSGIEGLLPGVNAILQVRLSTT